LANEQLWTKKEIGPTMLGGLTPGSALNFYLLSLCVIYVLVAVDLIVL